MGGLYNMFEFFKRKRCPQCGEELRMFKEVDYCSLNCAAIAKSHELDATQYITNPAIDVIYDATCEVKGFKPDAAEVVRIYRRIPERIHNEARIWGWQDTLVRESVYEFLEGELKCEE